ncbi:MAG: hypothetical protein Q9159_003933 [Coniocarpon cinnabarinum]
MTRAQYAGPDDGPTTPFPIKVRGKVIEGFGRGSKELGIPTANIPVEGLDVGGHTDLESGVYFGWAGLDLATATSRSLKLIDTPQNPAENALKLSAGPHTTAVYPAVLSIGFNPFYKNQKRSVEVHVIHDFQADFYNASMNLSILGFIRAEQDYQDLDALIADIKVDIEVSQMSLNRPNYEASKHDSFLTTFDWT